jgi:hypothetical protein
MQPHLQYKFIFIQTYMYSMCCKENVRCFNLILLQCTWIHTVHQVLRVPLYVMCCRCVGWILRPLPCYHGELSGRKHFHTNLPFFNECKYIFYIAHHNNIHLIKSRKVKVTIISIEGRHLVNDKLRSKHY